VPFGPALPRAGRTEVDLAAQAAAASFHAFSLSSGETRSKLLRAIADGIEGLGQALIECAARETALTPARLANERARTCAQLRLFAHIAAVDIWRQAVEEPADPLRKPQPKPQIYSRRIPIGPVAIFAASNFPLAFSVAGGDTASALAVGCPVIVKAHPGHPGTSALVGEVVRDVVLKANLPEGVFGLLFDSGHEAGIALVRHPAVRAAAFTGSRSGGLALWREANARLEPIPLFAEMGSVNPVFVFPSRATDAVAERLQASMTLGVGQFCTQPGLIFVLAGEGLDRFIATLSRSTLAAQPGVMLTPRMRDVYKAGLEARHKMAGVTVLASGRSGSLAGEVAPGLLAVDASTFQSTPELHEELFGPVSLIVKCNSVQEFTACADVLQGQLTASIWANSAELQSMKALLWALEQKVGRLVLNDVPTGVEVNAAMVHGGPFPATTDSRFTSVGTRALDRFVRVVARQGFGSTMVPPP
jgi:alpha-ketoglutaric semialdehyde dehydrogenase